MDTRPQDTPIATILSTLIVVDVVGTGAPDKVPFELDVFVGAAEAIGVLVNKAVAALGKMNAASSLTCVQKVVRLLFYCDL